MSDTARPKSAGDLLNSAEVNNDLPIEVTFGEAMTGATLPQPVYMHTDGKVYQCDANDTAKLKFIGFVIDTGAGDATGTLIKTMGGIVGGFSGLTIGSMYYVQDAVGTIGTTKGTYAVPVGRAISATEIQIIRLPLYAAGNLTDFNQAAASGDANYDETVTIGFKPRLIILHFFIQGNTAASGLTCKVGKATWEGTTIKGTLYYGADASGATDNVWGAINFTYDTDANAPTVGDTTNQGMKMTVTINSVSETGFVVRKAIDEGGSALGNARLIASYEAYE